MPRLRDVCLPLEKFDKCSRCAKETSFQFCSKCLNRIYCSKKCQKDDWPTHKISCSKAERVDLAVLYPFLAGLAEIGHCRTWKPFHPALTHQIAIPEPGPPDFDGVLIFLGNAIPEDEFTFAKWCPGLQTDKARQLFQRILHENGALPILMSISMALLSGIYTTRTPNGKVGEVRLTYRGSPVSDFGIAKGSVNVQNRNRLCYFTETPLHYMVLRGQDPEKHYWLYFKTLRGDEAVVDFSASTFNLGRQVKIDRYIPGVFPRDSFAPVLFQGDSVAEHIVGAHKEPQRFSVLRNDSLHTIGRHATAYRVTLVETDNMWDFMDTVAGRECEGIEKLITVDLVQIAIARIEAIVEERAWQKWPEKPEDRPCTDDAESSEWWDDLMKWKRRNKPYIPQDPISSTSRIDCLLSLMFQGMGISP